MQSLQANLPKDSILHSWLQSRSIIEPPVSYDLLTAMSAIGAMLKRNVWIDQVKFRIYPNMSVLLIGPSGIGKDTAIDGAEEILQAFDKVRIVGGMTSEALCDAMLGADPASAVILAPEFSDFFGSKDYQKDMVKTITELLSTKNYKDISTKSRPNVRIKHPTLTVLGGSTPSWLHKAMPEEAMSGGFYPRFVIICEQQPKREVAWVKLSIPQAEQDAARLAGQRFFKDLADVLRDIGAAGEIQPTKEAQGLYEEWYHKRRSYFSRAAQAYAHRCRDHGLRIAMLCAISRGKVQMDSKDISFALDVIQHIASRVDEALAPPHIEGQIARVILSMLPAKRQAIYEQLSSYRQRDIKDAFQLLGESHQVISKGEYYIATGESLT